MTRFKPKNNSHPSVANFQNHSQSQNFTMRRNEIAKPHKLLTLAGDIHLTNTLNGRKEMRVRCDGVSWTFDQNGMIIDDRCPNSRFHHAKIRNLYELGINVIGGQLQISPDVFKTLENVALKNPRCSDKIRIYCMPQAFCNGSCFPGNLICVPNDIPTVDFIECVKQSLKLEEKDYEFIDIKYSDVGVAETTANQPIYIQGKSGIGKSIVGEYLSKGDQSIILETDNPAHVKQGITSKTKYVIMGNHPKSVFEMPNEGVRTMFLENINLDDSAKVKEPEPLKPEPEYTDRWLLGVIQDVDDDNRMKVQIYFEDGTLFVCSTYTGECYSGWCSANYVKVYGDKWKEWDDETEWDGDTVTDDWLKDKEKRKMFNKVEKQRYHMATYPQGDEFEDIMVYDKADGGKQKPIIEIKNLGDDYYPDYEFNINYDLNFPYDDNK